MTIADFAHAARWDGHDRRRVHDPDYIGPERRGRTHDRRQGGTEQAVLDRLSAIERRLDAGSRRMDLQDDTRREQAAELRKNTAMTAELLDLFQTAKGGLKFLGALGVVAKWVGGLAAAAASIGTAIYMATHGGKPPGT